ncbi:MAG: DNA polymerase III subunit beta [Patescibacteria group bacterium]|nr:DNA polymerase III subunit beta [Patescibacteria group bacterium]
MKFSCLQENLKSGLLAVSHIAGKNINLPILNNILIKITGGDIKLITTDLEVGITCLVRGKVEKAGAFTVDAKISSDFISLLPNKKIDIEKKENKLIIKSDNYKTTIIGQSAEDYPLIPQIDKNSVYKADIEEFKRALTQVLFAVSTSETRVELAGVLFSFSGKNITLAATDSYRLAEKTINVSAKTNKKNDPKIIIPAKTLQELVRILSNIREEGVKNSEKEIEFYVSDNQILFLYNNIELISRLIEGQYPDYKQIIPINNKTTATINRDELIRAVKAAAIFSKTGINDINLDFPLGKNSVVVSSASSQAGENITKLAADVSGRENSIVVNCRYLLDGLNNISAEDLLLNIVDGNTPCTLRPEKNNSYQYIIMPIKQ